VFLRRKANHKRPFEPEDLEGSLRAALVELINTKRDGTRVTRRPARKTGGNVINLMDALEAQPRRREAG